MAYKLQRPASVLVVALAGVAAGCGATGEARDITGLIKSATGNTNVYRCGSYTPTIFVLNDPSGGQNRVIRCAAADFLATVAAAKVEDIRITGRTASATLISGRGLNYFFFLVRGRHGWLIRAVGGLPFQGSDPSRYGATVPKGALPAEIGRLPAAQAANP